MLSPEEQLRIIKSGAFEVVPEEALLKKLKEGRPLNVKLGVDPTAPDIHLGHAVPLRKLRAFQDLGHHVTLIIGDGTALIGDPSGRNSTRPQLTPEQVAANAQTYVDQAFKVLDKDATTLVHNSQWLLPMTLPDLLALAGNFTVARILERDDFHNRYTQQQAIGVHEFLYPMMQAYDSVHIKADVEVGGTDQLFNLLAGRELMEKNGMEPQVCLTLPLLEGTDGVQKMSKSYGNYIGLTDEPNEMFGKVMSIPDSLLVKYYRLASTVPVEDIDALEAALDTGEADPNQAKRALARNIVAAYYDEDTAQASLDHFVHTVVEKKVDEADVVAYTQEVALNDEGKVYLAKLLVDMGAVSGTGEARRLIDQGGVKLDDVPVEAGMYNIEPEALQGKVITAGKRKHYRLA